MNWIKNIPSILDFLVSKIQLKFFDNLFIKFKLFYQKVFCADFWLLYVWLKRQLELIIWNYIKYNIT